jgi:3,4-dihydroxy-2-butanone 4-phosphate synthase
MNLETHAPNVEKIFTCHHLTKLWQKVVNLKNEIDRKKAVRLFGEEFHTPSHIFLCIENAGCLQVQNGHTKLSIALAKLACIVHILVCQNPFYKTSSIPKLLN